MNRRQSRNGNGMFTDNRELMKTVVQQTTAENCWIDLEIASAKASFYGDFPKTGCTEEQFRPWCHG